MSKSKSNIRVLLVALFVGVALVCGGMHNSLLAQKADSKINVAVLWYDTALLLDYAIAAEMFLAADFMRAFNVYTVSRSPEVDLSIIGRAKADYLLALAPRADIVIVPGGRLWKEEAAEPETVEYLTRVARDGGTLYGICTGSLLLAKAGLLAERKATTNHQAIPMLRDLAPSATVLATADYVDDGNVVTTAGTGTAVEATLHLIERLTSREIATDLGERYLNYPHMPE